MISEPLQNFFNVELRNEDSMRREYGAPGSDEYEVASRDPNDELFIPESSLATALGSWQQADDEILSSWLGVPAAEVHKYRSELDALIVNAGEDAPLSNFIAGG